MNREITLKQWRIEESKRLNVSESVINQRLYGGKYPHLKLRRVNARVVYVERTLQ